MLLPVRQYGCLRVVLMLVFVLLRACESLDNGLARTPPMGWMSWERFRCNIDCSTDPNNCISEQLIKQTADNMASSGWLKAGYSYVIIDDCWLAKTRAADGRLQPDPDRFPSGIKALADYVHSRGLMFGIYGDIGTFTCGGYPGMAGHLELDAQTYADWGVDYLKVDGCNADIHTYADTYPQLGRALNKTSRPIVYSCSWPAYLPDPVATGFQVPYGELRQHCNLWRNWVDIQDSWASLKSIIMHWAAASQLSKGFTRVAGPGSWNDPDMLIVGDFGLDEHQSRVQFGMWAIFAAPLLMSNDLRDISDWAVQLLQNELVIAINQDPAGLQGELVGCTASDCSTGQVWARQLARGSVAVGLLNLGESSEHLCAYWPSLGLPGSKTAMVVDVFDSSFVRDARGKFCRSIKPTSMDLVILEPLTREDGAQA